MTTTNAKILLRIALAGAILTAICHSAGCSSGSVETSQAGDGGGSYSGPRTASGPLGPQGGTITGATTGGGLVVTTGKLGLDSAGCTTGQVKSWNGSTWACTTVASGPWIQASASGQQNDWSPTGLSTAGGVEVTNTGGEGGSALVITGITAPATDGRHLLICDVGSASVTLKNENSSSAAANRLHLNSASDLQLMGDTPIIGGGASIDCIELVYSTSLSRWRELENAEFPKLFASSIIVTNLSVSTSAALTGVVLGSDANASSHKITNLTNGSSAQDAAAFGQIASGVNAAVSGTTNNLAKFTGTNTIGNAAATDNGTTFTTTEDTSLKSGYVTVTAAGGLNIATAMTVNSGNTVTIGGPTTFNSTAPVTLGEYYYTVQSDSTASGIINDFALSAGTSMLTFAPTGTIDLTGITASTNGRRLKIRNVGTGSINFDDSNGLSLANNRLIMPGNASDAEVLGYSEEADCVYLTADNKWHCTILWDYVAPTSISMSKNLDTSAFLKGYSGVFGGSGGETFISPNGLAFKYGTASTQTGCINCDGYLDGSTQFRNLNVADGKNNSIAYFGQSANVTGGSLLQVFVDTTTINVAGPTVVIGKDSGSAVSFTNGPSGDNLYGGKHLEWVDDWMMGTLLTANIPVGSIYTFQQSGTGTGCASTATTNGRPGIVGCTTGTATAGGFAQVMSDPQGISFGDGSWDYQASVQWETLSSSSASVASMYTTLIGFADATINATDGCYFLYDKGNVATGNKNAGNVDALECWCANNATRTGYLINNTGNSDESFALGVGTVAANTWYRLEVKMTGSTRAEFYRNGTKVCDINTNVPSTAARATGAGFAQDPQASTGTGARIFDVDQTVLKVDLTSARSP